ncbi:hypothetical protein RSK60_3090001 [Ralstonia solanacearum K60]|nr:hypothetical protein RSK60_3090001 [Ralstonia solanacearum K60]
MAIARELLLRDGRGGLRRVATVSRRRRSQAILVMLLAEIFAPALAQCECKKMIMKKAAVLCLTMLVSAWFVPVNFFGWYIFWNGGNLRCPTMCVE